MMERAPKTEIQTRNIQAETEAVMEQAIDFLTALESGGRIHDVVLLSDINTRDKIVGEVRQQLYEMLGADEGEPEKLPAGGLMVRIPTRYPVRIMEHFEPIGKDNLSANLTMGLERIN